MNVKSLIKKIRKNLNPSLLKGNWTGHCYVASECFYHIVGGKKAGYKPMFIKHDGASHWWIQGPNKEIIDITADQFTTPIDYSKSKGKGFLTKKPSKRALKLINLSKCRR